MKVVFWGNGNRGVSCLRSLHESVHDISLVVAHPGETDDQWYASVSQTAREMGQTVIDPQDPNSLETQQLLDEQGVDVFIFAGYGKILREYISAIPRLMSVNLHGGKLPKYRGSSPLNWALINGEASFTLTVTKLEKGIDTGGIIAEKTFVIGINDTICDLHEIANREFPSMLLQALVEIEHGTCPLQLQDEAAASYYPMRFPDDGLILWDIFTAAEIHNRIRALTDPYPGTLMGWTGWCQYAGSTCRKYPGTVRRVFVPALTCSCSPDCMPD